MDPSFSMAKLEEFKEDDEDFDVEMHLEKLKERYGFEVLSPENEALFSYARDVEVMGFHLAEKVNDFELDMSQLSFRNRMRIIYSYIREIQNATTDPSSQSE